MARAAVTGFRERYNRHWRLEKLDCMSPLEARGLMPGKWRLELQNRVQSIRAGTAIIWIKGRVQKRLQNAKVPVESRLDLRP